MIRIILAAPPEIHRARPTYSEPPTCRERSMRVRGRRATLVLALLAMSLVGCAHNDPGGGAESGGIPPAPANLVGTIDNALRQQFPARIQASGVLRLAADPSYPPSTFKDEAG